MVKTNRSNLDWPAGLAATRQRRAWFDRLSALPPGLSIDEVARRLGRPYPTVATWVRWFRYPHVDRRQLRWGVSWDAVDWSCRDGQIAAGLGVSRQAVSQRRQALGFAPARDPARNKQFRERLAAKKAQIVGAAGMGGSLSPLGANHR